MSGNSLANILDITVISESNTCGKSFLVKIS
jgi:hypothetical protein